MEKAKTSRLYVGDCRSVLTTIDAGSVDCCVTSPPYFGLRDYGHDGQIGLEETPEAYVAKMVAVFREVRRVLRDDATLWLNLGDTYASAWPCNRRNVIGTGSLPNGKREARPPRIWPGLKEKDLIGIPWRVAFALQADGWYLRQDIIWHKPNPMPESVTDRCTKAHEYIFLLSKSARYYYDAEAVKEQTTRNRANVGGNLKGCGIHKIGGVMKDIGDRTNEDAARYGRNRRSVWTVTTKPFKGAHFATFPPDLILPCVLAGCKPGGTVLDPFNGAGTTGLVSLSNCRNYIGIELNQDYATLSMDRWGILSCNVERIECTMQGGA